MQHFAVEYKQASHGAVGCDNVKIISFHLGSFHTPSVAAHYPEHYFK